MPSTALSPAALAEKARTFLMPNYGERGIAMVRGEGARCWNAEGSEYLDFLGGIAVNNVGHCHPAVVAAIREQSARLLHASNLYLLEPQVLLAERLVHASGMAKAFFSNSGTEATEGGMKLARRWANDTRGPGHDTILTFEHSFHGRTYGSMSATWSPKVRAGFGPMLPGVRFVKLNEIDSIDAAWDDSVCAVMLETVQGEGGIRVATKEFLEALRLRCTERHALLLADEIQCGMGRTGRPFAYQHATVEPDIVLSSKALGGGLPLGAVLAGPRVCDVFQPGSHGSTFGGNPVACAAALAVCDIVFDEAFLREVGRKGCKWWGALSNVHKRHPTLVKEIRGMGLMIGMELTRPGADMVAAARRHGLLLNCTSDTVLRFVPPLIISDADIEEAAARFSRAFDEWAATLT